MKFGKEFFALQVRFAHRIAELSGLPLERALLDYINLYIRFALGREFDAAHPVWRDYLDGLARAADAEDWTYGFFLTRPPAEPPGLLKTSGCFSCSELPDGRIRLHFEDAEQGGVSPLRGDRRQVRLEELSALFQHVARVRPKTCRIAGISWLYNLAAYRRLFPETYLASATPAPWRFRNMPLWGQFIDRHGAVRQEPARIFLERLSRQATLEDLPRCFPLQPLAVEAPLADFLASHGLGRG